MRVADDYPAEFSVETAGFVGMRGPLGPYFIEHDGVVIGEAGGSWTSDGEIEIGYGIVPSAWGRGHATAAVGRLLEHAREHDGLERLVAHAPVDRPGSGRVLEKSGFVPTAEFDEEVDGTMTRLVRWELGADALAALGTFDALYDAATRRRDGDAAAALFAGDRDVTMWGSDEAERAVGPEAVAQMLRGIAASGSDLDFRWSERRVRVEGDVAWVNARGDVRGGPYRTTAVLVRRDGAWRWHTHSGSIPD
jgi:ketosteroid isomerase-like protein